MFRGHTPLKIYDHCLRYLQSFSTQRSRQSLLFNSTLRTTIAPTVQDPKEDPTVQDPTVQGDRTTTRFKRQPAAPIHAPHSIAKDSDHNAARQGRSERRSDSPRSEYNRGSIFTPAQGTFESSGDSRPQGPLGTPSAAGDRWLPQPPEIPLSPTPVLLPPTHPGDTAPRPILQLVQQTPALSNFNGAVARKSAASVGGAGPL